MAKPTARRAEPAPLHVALPIRLDQALQRMDAAATGGHAKLRIQDGEVRVNGEVETRRGRKMAAGDLIEVDDQRAILTEG